MHANSTFLPTALPAFKREERPAPQVARWAFDADIGHITGIDEHGRVLMWVEASPLFGPRLAAAFGAAAAGQSLHGNVQGRAALPF